MMPLPAPVPQEPMRPPVGEMTTDEMLREVVRDLRELRAALLPILENPAALFASMPGPMGSMLANFMGPRR